MNLKSHIFEGVFKTIPKGEDFELEITLSKSPLKIKGLSKKLLIENQIKLSEEHAIYILEGPTNCYVGQSKDVQSRIKNHTDKNKAEFDRCFILSSSNKNADWRGYLDYMESYTIREMEYLGYLLENTKKPNPDDDILSNYKKEMANDWIDEFLSFLPILGFKKSPTQIGSANLIASNNNIRTTSINKNAICLKYNGNLISGLDSRDIFKKLLELIGLGVVEKQCNSIFDTTFKITTTYSKPKYGACHNIVEKDKKYFLYLNISKKDLIKKIIKIKEILKLDIEIN